MPKHMDRKLVAFSKEQRYEVASVARKFKVPAKYVREVMLEIGKNGKPARSRELIEKELIRMLHKRIENLLAQIEVITNPDF